MMKLRQWLSFGSVVKMRIYIVTELRNHLKVGEKSVGRVDECVEK